MNYGLEALLIGRTLAGRYEIEAIIGRGGMSVVHRARDRTLGRPVAVKVISLPAQDPAAREQLRARFRREAGAAAGIPPHPNVVHIYDYGTDPELDLDFIVMELLRGRDLKAAIAEAALTRPQALRVLLEAARGLAAGHRAGIVHRDVKPANIFLVGEEKLESVRVLDFGIAKALEAEDDLTHAGETPPHSPAYASPEQLSASRPVTPAADVFQLGLVAYELLAGARPFVDAQRERLRAGEVMPLPARGDWENVPDAVRRVIERALHADPEARFRDAAEFAEALAAASGADRPREDRFRSPSPASAASPSPYHEEMTLLEVPATGVASAPASPTGVPVGSLSRAPARRSLGGPGKALRLAALGLLLLAGAWGVVRLAGGSGGELPAEAAELDFQALEAEFRQMQDAAARALLEATAVTGDAESARQVQQVIVDLYHSWAEGDLERHAGHYAARVDFYDRRRVRRSSILRDRRRDRERYDEVAVTVERQAITFPEPGRARALVDRSWRMHGPEIHWDGAARQEFHLEQQQGRWVITAEDEVEVYRSECTGC